MASATIKLVNGELRKMPTYEFFCHSCEKPFVRAYSFEQYEHDKKRKKIKCPHCGSARIERQISAFEAKTSKKS